MIGVIDCNNFFVSCERAFQPRLEGVPVGVLSNNDDCVIARSNELKALDVVLSSNYELYGDMSSRVQQVLEEFSAGVEPYSIDEMFVRFDGFAPRQMHRHAQELFSKVRRFTHIPVCVGIAPTRTLALSV